MTKDFEGKTILITGAGSGLGQATAIELGKQGASLSLVDLNEAALLETAEQIRKENPEADILTLAADVSKAEQVENYVTKTVEKFNQIDGFFNNAGMEGKQDLTQDYGIDEFKKVIDVNLDGVFYGLKYVLKVMREQGFGQVVNTASVGGTRGVGNQSGYAASKHGVIGLTRNSGVEYGQFGISINAIAPGAIMTPMVENSLRQMGGENWEAAGKEFVSVNPMKRFGRPQEVAYLVSFLLSDKATFINGAVVPIDGGQSFKY
ncbi:short chain dehydrogenase [Listeria floridensis FSL S10-1187]|uniref:Short chain dehydrogenase n=1 Tax=Listeria floridensis FSL S10-1187 TaxID=1265817 RepID=A0ABP3B0A0_9LIST|nr:SDR family oxidoreductase [Listeria floridensis]EUJ31973.1 short chain dehydrogenase [Listeria floridensis FSL S10-1187]